MMGLRESYIALAIVTVLVLLLSGCKKERDSSEGVASRSSSSNEAALFPGSSFELTEREVLEKTDAAEKGDKEAMRALENYYLFYKDDDRKGWYWMEKLAEAGDMNARETILDHYANSSSDQERKYGETLREKWQGVSVLKDPP